MVSPRSVAGSSRPDAADVNRNQRAILPPSAAAGPIGLPAVSRGWAALAVRDGPRSPASAEQRHPEPDVVPSPSTDSTATDPSCRSTMVCTIRRPRPVPAISARWRSRRGRTGCRGRQVRARDADAVVPTSTTASSPSGDDRSYAPPAWRNFTALRGHVEHRAQTAAPVAAHHAAAPPGARRRRRRRGGRRAPEVGGRLGHHAAEVEASAGCLATRPWRAPAGPRSAG